MTIEKFYLKLLDEHKRTGFLFGLFELPSGIPAVFIAITVFLAALFQSQFSLYHIPLAFAIVISWEMIVVVFIRSQVLEECVFEELFLETALEIDGGDPHFPGSPKCVVDSDRHSIFLASLMCKLRTPFHKQIKKHYAFLVCIVLLYTGFCELIGFILRSSAC